MSDEFNSKMALEFVQICQTYWASRAEYFEKEYFRRRISRGGKFYYWSFNEEAYFRNIELQHTSTRTSESDSIFKVHARRKAADARKQCGSIHEKDWAGAAVLGEDYVVTYPCCPYRNEAHKNEALKKHIDSIEKIQASEFYSWLDKLPAFLVAVEKLSKRKMVVAVHSWEMGGMPATPGPRIGGVLLLQCLAKTLLVIHNPQRFGRLISDSWLLREGPELTIPKRVVNASREILEFLQESGVSLKTLNRYLELLAEGSFPERFLGKDISEIEYYFLEEFELSESAKNRLLVLDLANQLNGRYYSDRTKNERFPPDILADLCLVVGYSADPRQIQNLQKRLDKKRELMGIRSQSALLDPLLNNFKHEEILQYLAK